VSITTYTEYDEVRAILGVDDEELLDATIALDIYDTHLVGELEDINLILPSDYAVIAAIAASARTQTQQRFYSATRLFAAYAIAKHLSSALPMFGPKDITDGKAGVSRFADAPYKAVIAAIKAEYDRLRPRLETAYAAISSGSTSTTARVYFAKTGLATDPVTGV